MLLLISPAKTLDFSNNVPETIIGSKPIFMKEAMKLVTILQTYSAPDLEQLLDISSKLSELNHQRFKDFKQQLSKPALYAYKGDVYEGFELKGYTQKDIDFANQHLRIISGLYGLLKPLDLIQAYRLEMSINLANPAGKNLYNFWQDKITNTLNQEPSKFIVNLASQEYSSAITKLNKPMINITFKESHKGTYKIIGIHAKKARGVMANFIIRNQLKELNEIKEFNLNNYKFMPELTSESEYVFIR